ncbi:hypothetical protein [Hydrogenimonas sp. SS33]|uniref:hypothetical protein n=1 Tax=Hydrogenimonas leucolamina TaxID=2954236 RepID=UPI00336BCF07
MNRIEARIVEVREHEGVSQVTFDADGKELTMIGLELPGGVEPARQVTLGIKATHLFVSKKPLLDAAVANRLPVIVESVTEGAILVSLKLLFGTTPLECILPKSALPADSFKAGDTAVALFQASELSIVEVL